MSTKQENFMFYTVASQNARDEGFQADAESKSVDNFETHGKGLVLEESEHNPRIRRLFWYRTLSASASSSSACTKGRS